MYAVTHRGVAHRAQTYDVIKLIFILFFASETKRQRDREPRQLPMQLLGVAIFAFTTLYSRHNVMRENEQKTGKNECRLHLVDVSRETCEVAQREECVHRFSTTDSFDFRLAAGL